MIYCGIVGSANHFINICKAHVKYARKIKFWRDRIYMKVFSRDRPTFPFKCCIKDHYKNKCFLSNLTSTGLWTRGIVLSVSFSLWKLVRGLKWLPVGNILVICKVCRSLKKSYLHILLDNKTLWPFQSFLKKSVILRILFWELKDFG